MNQPMNQPMNQHMNQPQNYPNLAPQQFNPRPPQQQANMGEFVPTVSSLEEKRKFIQGNTICVVDVYGDWCGPCKSIAPKYADMFKKYAKPGLCVLLKENADLGLSPDVRGVPTFQFFVNGVNDGNPVIGADIRSVEERLVKYIGEQYQRQ